MDGQCTSMNVIYAWSHHGQIRGETRNT